MLNKYTIFILIGIAFILAGCTTADANLGAAPDISLKDGGTGQTYMVWIQPTDEYAFDSEATKGRSKKGDIISIRLKKEGDKPTDTELANYIVIEVDGLTEEQIDNYTETWETEPDEKGDYEVLASRKWRGDVDTLQLKVGWDTKTKDVDAFKNYVVEKTSQDLIAYEKARKLYVLKNTPKKLALQLRDYIFRPAMAADGTPIVECISCADGGCDHADCNGDEDYSTITLWEAGTDVDMAASIAVGLVYDDDSPVYEQVSIAGATRTDADHYRILTVAEADRHNGIVDNGVSPVGMTFDLNGNITRPITTGEHYAVVEWFRIRNWSGNNGRNGIATGNFRTTIRNNIIHNGVTCAGGGCGGIATGTHGGAFIYNNIIANITGATSTSAGRVCGIRTNRGQFYNNTIYNITETNLGFSYGVCAGAATTPPTFINNVATDNTDDDFEDAQGRYNDSSDYNACASTTCVSEQCTGGANDVPNIVTADQYVSLTGDSENLHLKTGADLIEAGTDGSGLAIWTDGWETGAFDIDIDDDTRPQDTLWEIGADEFISAAPPAVELFRRRSTNDII